jgi:hypothetical protein
VDLATHDAGAIDADGVDKDLERQPPRLIAVQRGAHRRVAEPIQVCREALPNRTFDDSFEECAMLVFEADSQRLCEQHGSAGRDTHATLGGQALDLLTARARHVRRDGDVGGPTRFCGGHGRLS